MLDEPTHVTKGQTENPLGGPDEHCGARPFRKALGPGVPLPWSPCLTLAALGERERSPAVVEASAKERESGLRLRYATPLFDSTQDDPRFEVALRSFHRPEAITRKAPRPRFQRST